MHTPALGSMRDTPMTTIQPDRTARPGFHAEATCVRCRRLLGKASQGQVVTTRSNARTVLEIKCRYCKAFNYIGPAIGQA